VEPEGWDTVEIYLNGFSTSLPEEVQRAALSRIPAFAQARLFRPGYAVEYDFFPPTQLDHTLETKLVEGLFFAGQINGTTGYEEAACQGLMAGINAHLRLRGKDALILRRDEAYIGVLIDDLVTKGTDEPYRMFTSRAEYRISLRQDNADLRLTPRSHAIGLASDERMRRIEQKTKLIGRLDDLLRTESVAPETADPLIVPRGTAPLRQKTKLRSLLLRPELGLGDLRSLSPALDQALEDAGDLAGEVQEQLEISAKYESYLDKERSLAERLGQLEHVPLDADIDYSKFVSLSMEARMKLERIKPRTIGQASRICGVSPADLSVLLVYMNR
jgi:tRNA uridine 5-carboxymethylaminomethyl modification enzyme